MSGSGGGFWQGFWEKGWPDIKAFCRSLWRCLLRSFAIFTVLSGLFVAIGSIIKPYWWFGFFWNEEHRNLSQNWTALLAILKSHPLISAIMVVGAAGIVAFCFVRKQLVLCQIDRFGAFAILGSVVVVSVAALVVYSMKSGSYDNWKREQDSKKFAQETRKLWSDPSTLSRFSQPNIQAPVHFYYLDRNEVDTDYSQVEEELTETERKVQESQNQSTEIGVDKGISAHSGSTTQISTAHTLKQINLTTERKCIKLMNFSAEQRGARVYSTRFEWLAVKTIQVSAPLSFGGNPSREDIKEINRRLSAYNEKTLESELGNLRGLIFVRGQIQLLSDRRLLVHDFAYKNDPAEMYLGKAEDIRFEVSAPVVNEWERLRNDAPAQVTVFGYVVHPLDSHRTIVVRAIAIY